jgi:signal transduction histidine kinase
MRSTGISVDVDVSGAVTPLPPAVELAAYRIVQEGLTNVLKHAAATRAVVRVGIDADVLVVEVVDDGAGAGATDGGGHGLAGMRERVALFGGALRAGDRVGGGFEIHARIPVA